jgi:hypothetical protein
VVDVDAVEFRRLIELWIGARRFTVDDPDCGGQYCWWKSGYGFTSAGGWGFDSERLGVSAGTRCTVFWNNPSLSGVSGPGESGSGFGPLPLRSAKFGCGCDCDCDCLEFRLGRNAAGISDAFEPAEVAESGEVVRVRKAVGGGLSSG